MGIYPIVYTVYTIYIWLINRIYFEKIKTLDIQIQTTFGCNGCIPIRVHPFYSIRRT